MLKHLMIILFSAFLGIIGAPEVLMASEDFLPNGLNSEKIVETVQIEEEPPVEEPAPEPVQTNTVTAYNTTPVVPAPVYQAPAVPANRIEIGGRTIEIIDSNDTRNDAGKYVARYNDRFMYGHNSSVVFDVLYRVGIGSTFSVTYGGVTTMYQIKNIIIYRKTGDTSLRVEDANSDINGEDVAMKYVAKEGREKENGRKYSIALMTCYGTSYGNGDASHRLVVFANAI